MVCCVAGSDIDHVPTSNHFVSQIGTFIDTNKVDCIVIMLGSNLRISWTVQRLLNIIFKKIRASDYSKVAFVVNYYGHSDAKQQQRASATGQDEATSQEQIRSAIRQGLQGESRTH